MKVVMVTGGAGFMGSNFIRYLMETYPDFIVINYDKLTDPSYIKNVKDLEGNPKYYFVKGDICDTKQAKKIISQCDPDYVINFASEADTETNSDNRLQVGKTNFMGTLNLLDCLQSFWENRDTQENRFLQVSTDEVYGSLESREECITEESKILPSSPYSAAKAGAELIGRAFFETYKFPIIITRCCNNYGPYQDRDKFIPRCIIKALKSEPITIYGDGTTMRDWIHVRDHCSAVASILFKGQPGEVYNIGSGEEVSKLEIARMIIKNIGEEANDGNAYNEDEHSIVNIPDSNSKDSHNTLNSDKIKNCSEWQCSYTLTEGIKDTIKWYKEHTEWWDEEKS